ncbi:HEAT repeat domain-containing protein [Pendulispora albinea]|uniref:HEAT repeat domain-containing protein n=1 Tax=Pendulispora albinea TaxID=2741071 RepID=A0ABZ2LM49_9BACT
MRSPLVLAAIVATVTAAATVGHAPPAFAVVWPDVPERVARALTAQDPVTRRMAAQELSTLGRARGTPLVLAALGDPDVEVKLAAAQSAIRLRATGATSAVLPWLGDREARLRIAACEVARALPDARAIQQLARGLGDADAAVRAAAADALGTQASADAVAPLLGRLDDASPQVRIQIARALARLGDKRAVVPLVGKVQDSVVDVRQAVVRALGELGDARASQALILTLRDNANEVRVESLHALGRLRTPEAVETISPFATDRNPALRQAALAALGRIGTRESMRALIGALGVADDAGGGLERTPARQALVAVGSAATAPISELSAVLKGSPNPQVATSVAWVLGELRAQSEAPTIISAMRRGVLPSAAALHALAGAGTRDSIPVVLEYVGDKNPVVRSEAARAAKALLDPTRPDGRAVEPLAAALRNTNLSQDESAALAILLGRTGAPRAAPILVSLSNTKKFPVLRLAAIDALGTLGPADADDALLEKLDDSDATVRLHAAIALGDAGKDRAREALLGKLDGGEELDRAAVLTALGGVLARVPSEGAIIRLARALELGAGPERDALLLAIGRSNLPSAVRALGTLLRSNDPDDRRTIATVLSAQPSGGPAEALARGLLRDPDPTVRAQAAWSMGALGDAADRGGGSGGIDALTAVIPSPDLDTAINATAAVGRLAARARSAPLAVRVLCPLLRDARTYVRVNALAGLAATGARCGDGSSERAALADDGNDLVRSAAAAVLQRPSPASMRTADTAALERCAQSDRSGAVAQRCRGGIPARADTAPGATHAVDVYVVPDTSTTPRARVAYALHIEGGYLRAGIADRRGACFEPVAPDGELSLERPSAQAR